MPHYVVVVPLLVMMCVCTYFFDIDIVPARMGSAIQCGRIVLYVRTTTTTTTTTTTCVHIHTMIHAVSSR